MEFSYKRERICKYVFRITNNGHILSILRSLGFIITVIFFEHVYENRQRKLLFYIIILVNIVSHDNLTADKPAVMSLIARLTFVGERS